MGLIQKRVMAPFTYNVLGLTKVMCEARVTLLSFGTREYTSDTSTMARAKSCMDYASNWLTVRVAGKKLLGY